MAVRGRLAVATGAHTCPPRSSPRGGQARPGLDKAIQYIRLNIAAGKRWRASRAEAEWRGANHEPSPAASWRLAFLVSSVARGVRRVVMHLAPLLRAVLVVADSGTRCRRGRPSRHARERSANRDSAVARYPALIHHCLLDPPRPKAGKTLLQTVTRTRGASVRGAATGPVTVCSEREGDPRTSVMRTPSSPSLLLRAHAAGAVFILYVGGAMQATERA